MAQRGKRYDYIIIGGGIVGASVAWQLQSRESRRRILLLEKEQDFGLHQTGRNSGVIHAGVYYEPGSLKARFCREGHEATMRFCQEEGIPWSQCGKLIVATTDLESKRLGELEERCRLNDVETQRLDARQLREREPNVAGMEALYVPATGITDFREVCLHMLERFRALGGECCSDAAVAKIVEYGNGVDVVTAAGHYRCGFLVVCAGLMADRMAQMHGIEVDFRIVPFRGEYFRLAPEHDNLVQHLVYPVPDPALPFVGVHLTRLVHGGIIMGPNAVTGWKREAYGRFNFSVRDAMSNLSFPGFWRAAWRYRRAAIQETARSISTGLFLKHARKLCPELKSAKLIPHPTGVRAQALGRDGRLVHDFLFKETPRSLHVCNAPSPAATSAIPIGRHVCELISERIGVSR